MRCCPAGCTVTLCSETWIVMDLMDRGNLAAAVRHSRLFMDDAGGLNAVRRGVGNDSHFGLKGLLASKPSSATA